MTDILLISNRVRRAHVGRLAGGEVVLGEINSLLSLLNVADAEGYEIDVRDLEDGRCFLEAVNRARIVIVDLGRIS